MSFKKFIATLMCVLAFTLVFAHSVVPHEHHCLEQHESHIHHFGNCEQLNTYILSDAAFNDVAPEFFSLCYFTCSEAPTGLLPKAEIPMREFLCSEYFFSDKRVSLPPLSGRRAPPAKLA